MGEPKIDYEAWSRSMLGFIRAKGLEVELRDWCGGFPCPITPAESRAPSPDPEAVLCDRPAPTVGKATREWVVIPADDTPGHREPVMVDTGAGLWAPVGTKDPNPEATAAFIVCCVNALSAQKALKESDKRKAGARAASGRWRKEALKSAAAPSVRLRSGQQRSGRWFKISIETMERIDEALNLCFGHISANRIRDPNLVGDIKEIRTMLSSCLIAEQKAPNDE